jgi:Glycosyl hydrolases family 39
MAMMKVSGLRCVGAALMPVLLLSSAACFTEARSPGWGFTHTQFSADHGEADAIASVQAALRVPGLTQNQHIMGWGAENPEPAPGVYDFTSLDNRMAFIRETGGVPVITLCCAPDWMKGGTAGQTDWATLTSAPLREHYGDYAALSAVIARRYPDVRHFIVWNEFKGFFDEGRNNWDAAGYTDLYNQVYDAVKAVNTQNRVGGPYMSMTTTTSETASHASGLRGPWGAVDQRAMDAVDHWLTHNHGADFIVVDGHAETDGAPDEFAALDKFSAVSQWVRARTTLPLWWAEWYVEPTGQGWTDQRETALRAAAMIEMARSGVSTALYWNPEPTSAGCATCLWTDTRADDGGTPLPFLATLQAFARWFPPGTRLRGVAVPPEVRVLAQEQAIVIVNTVDATVPVELDGGVVRLGPYETRWITP